MVDDQPRRAAQDFRSPIGEQGGRGSPLPSREPLRLLHLLVGFTVGGAERLVLDLARGADPDRWRVTVASLKGPGPFLLDFQQAGLRTATLGGRGKGDPRPLLRLARLLRGERIQVLHAHTFRANLAARLAGRWAGTPVVVTSLHGSDRWMGRRHRLAERLTAPLSSVLSACSADVQGLAAARVGLRPEAVRVVHNGIDPARFTSLPPPAEARRALGLPAGGLLAGFVGRLVEPLKGLEALLGAVERAAARVPGLLVVVAGDGPSRPWLEREIVRRGLGPSFRLLGEVGEVPRLLAALDLLLLPSLDEGFGLAAAEAMAAGLPVIASRVGGIPELVEEGRTGLLVPPGDEVALAGAIQQLAGDPEKRAVFGAAGRRRVISRFTAGHTREQFESLYREFLGPAGAGG